MSKANWQGGGGRGGRRKGKECGELAKEENCKEEERSKRRNRGKEEREKTKRILFAMRESAKFTLNN